MKKPPNPKGLYCPGCQGVRLTCLKARSPCPGVKVRYRACAACGTRLKTEERVVAVTAGAS